MSDNEAMPEEANSVPMMSPELKEKLREKLAELEILEEKTANGEIPSDEAQELLADAMLEVEAILEVGRELEREFIADQEAQKVKLQNKLP